MISARGIARKSVVGVIVERSSLQGLRLGFLGVGVMGSPMARNLMKAGYSVTVCDLNPDRVAALAAVGAHSAASPADLAESTDAVITMLPMPADTDNAIFGESGLVHGLRPGATVVDMSTNSPTFARHTAKALEERGFQFLEAPVTLGEPAAIRGDLTIMVAGRAAIFQQFVAVFRAMGKKIFFVQDFGHAQLAKLVGNLVALVTLGGIAEGLVLATKNGVSSSQMYDILTESIGDSRELRHAGPEILKGNFEPGFALELAFKDLDLVLGLGRDSLVPLPLTSSLREQFQFARARGLGQLDVRSVIKVLEEACGIAVRTPTSQTRQAERATGMMTGDGAIGPKEECHG
jgi:3-hydroxyisobutyrate dehydrogenase-like beta-hydroxyacid dehydrogenase